MIEDKQVIEILGRNRLVDELLRAGLEVALPLRDRGVDLIAYADRGDGVAAFSAKPIQMKAASCESFSIDLKYKKFSDMILAFVWSVSTGEPRTYALTYEEAFGVAEQMGFTKTPSWEAGRYSCSSISSGLRSLLEAHKMTPDKWWQKITGNPGASARFRDPWFGSAKNSLNSPALTLLVRTRQTRHLTLIR